MQYNQQIYQQQQALQKARARMRAAQQTVPTGGGELDVGACAPGYNQGGFPTPGYPWNARQEFWGLPQLAPPPFPGLLRTNLYRLGAIVQASSNHQTKTFELSPANGASLYVAGLLTRNDAFQVIINSIEQGSIGFSPVSEVDAATFNTDDCYCPIELGCANNLTPLVISFTGFQDPSQPQYLNMVAVGTFDAGFGTCGVPYQGGYNSPIPPMPGAGFPGAWPPQGGWPQGGPPQGGWPQAIPQQPAVT